jgi:phosphatidylinositol alpha-mannosyltransferase
MYPNVRLILASAGAQIGEMRRFVRKERLADVLFAGRVSDVDKARFLKTADIFCAPSTGQESFGIVLLEAMAAGRAVIASDIHGYKKVVQRNVTGLLVEPKDPDALCRAIAQLVDDPALRDRLGAAGARRASDFDWAHVARQLVDVYEEVLQRTPARA